MAPDILMKETTREKIRPETTGAGIAYLRRSLECRTIARPRKITMAAKPNAVRYSNLNEAIAPSAGGV